MGRIGYALIGLLLLANGGCIWVALGGAAAAGGAAASYVYVRGRLYHDYHTDLAHAQAGVQAAMNELQLTLLQRELDDNKVTFETSAADGTAITVYLKTWAGRIPTDGPVTRVSVRVGAFGDEEVSARILQQVDQHLLPPGQLPINPPPGFVPVQPASATRPADSAEPQRLVPVPQPPSQPPPPPQR
jgi:hypothetical protein